MKVQITIEQYDNGISLHWKDASGEISEVKKVAYDREEERMLGEMILDDIRHLLDKNFTEKVIMEIEYKGE